VVYEMGVFSPATAAGQDTGITETRFFNRRGEMEKIRTFYRGLSRQRRIVFWVCLFVVFSSIVRVSVWQVRKGSHPGSREYVRKLASQNPNEKKFAIYEVGRRGLKSAIPSLEKIIKEDSSPEMKRAAAWGIGKIDRDKLVSLLDSAQKEVKHIIMETLMKLDRGNVSVLMDRFSSEEEGVKLEILAFADSSGREDIPARMVEIGEDTGETLKVRMAALEVAARHMAVTDIESRLWNLYYNDKNEEMKKFSYDLIKRLKEKK